MSHPDRPDDAPEVVSVSFRAESLTNLEGWDMVLTRLAPGSRRPVLRTVAGVLYVLLSFPFLGFVIGMAGWPSLQPGSMAVVFFALGLLYPLRVWRIKRQLIGVLEAHGPLTIEVGTGSATVLSKDRATRIEWAGVREVRAGRRQVVLRYRAGDASWIPSRAFAGPEHRARFLEVARSGLARSCPPPSTPPEVSGRAR